MHKLRIPTAVTGFLILFFFVISCTKIDTTSLGKDLIPTVDNINTFDTTLDVIATNFDIANLCDSVRRNDLHVLGIIANDPYFGSTKGSIYLELKPQTFPFTFPDHDKDSIIIDSVVLALSYSHSYGDSNSISKVQVYPLTDGFKNDSIYTTCNIFNYTNNLLGEKTFRSANLKDSIFAFRESTANQLRIPIKKSFVQSWVDNDVLLLKNDSTFKTVSKGFAIVPDASVGGSALNYFNLANANTRLSIYVRTSKGNVKDTSIVDFPMTIYSGEANSIIRNRGTSEITQHLNQPTLGDQEIYLQTSPGTYGEIKIPGLTNMSNRVILRAELIVDQVYSANTSDDIYDVPYFLYLDTKDTSTNGKYIPIPCDFTTIEVQNNFHSLGGHPNKVVNNLGQTINRYIFNISRYVQTIVTKKDFNATLRLRAPYYIQNKMDYIDRCNQMIPLFSYGLNNIADGRVKVNGSNNTPSRMRMRIIYSKIP
ncbi:MAG: DUF4270 family protein [Ginsengibacter sp.]